MENSAPNIPGFYFDPEKNRYFKINGEHNGKSCEPQPASHKTSSPPTKQSKNIAKVIRNNEIYAKSHSHSAFSQCALENRIGRIKDANTWTWSQMYLRIVYGRTDGQALPILDMQAAPDFSGALVYGQGVLRHTLADYGQENFNESVWLCEYEQFLDFSFVMHGGKPLNYITTCVPTYNHSIVRLGSTSKTDEFVCKNLTDVPFACKGNQVATDDVYAVSYSMGKKTVLVKSIEKHFAERTPVDGFAHNLSFPCYVSCHCFSKSSPFHLSGLTNGTTALVDWRCKNRKKRQTIIGSAGSGGIKDLHISRDDRQLITRCIGEKDRVTLWDIRKSSVPLFDYISIEGQRKDNIANSRISVFDDRILSCVALDGNAYMWNVTTGKLFFMLDQSNARISQRVKGIAFTNKYLSEMGAPAMYCFTNLFYGLYCLIEDDEVYTD